MRRLMAVLAVLVGTVTMGLVTVPTAVAGAAGATQTIYNNTTTAATRTLDYDWSAAYEATQMGEFGNQVAFAPGTSRILNNVQVATISYACQVSGNAFSGDADPCVSNPNATFSQPLTLNLYNVGPDNSVGTLIDSVQQTFNIPYRPDGDDTHCPADVYGNPAGLYWDGYHCNYGITSFQTFNLPNITVPDKLIWSLALNTSGYGPNPLGSNNPCNSSSQGCPYDELNIAWSANTDTNVGSDPLPDSAYVNSALPYGQNGGGYYCGSGTAGMFSLDNQLGVNGCTAYDEYNLPVTAPTGRYLVPEAQFNAVATNTSVITSAPSVQIGLGKKVHFTVTTSGHPAATLSTVGLPAGLTFTPLSKSRAGTASLSGSPAGGAGNFSFLIIANNGNGFPAAVQTFTVDVLGISSPAGTSFSKSGPPTQSFTITTTGAGAGVSLSASLGAKDTGLVFHDNGNGTATISGQPGATARTATVKVTAVSGASIATQRLAIGIAS